MRRGGKCLVLLTLLFLLLSGLCAYAAEAGQTGTDDGSLVEELLSQMDLEGPEVFLSEGDGGIHGLSFADLVRGLLAGDNRKVQEQLKALFSQGLAAESGRAFRFALRILALGVAGAVFAAAAGAFPEGEVAETGGFLINLLLAAALAAALKDGAEAAKQLLRRQADWMGAVIPAYSMVVAWTGCHTAAVAWMEFLLFLLHCVNRLYLSFLLPLVQVYVLLAVAGGLMREDRLSGAAGFLKGLIVWGSRFLVGVVLGFEVVQGMVLPFADSLKTAGMQKLLAVVPGVGTGAEAVTRLVLGSGVVLKNAVGAAAVLVLAALSLGPLLHLLLFAVLYQAAAALLQPVAGRRMIRVLSGAAEGQKLLLRIAAYGAAVFALALALLCLGTNAAYLA